MAWRFRDTNRRKKRPDQGVGNALEFARTRLGFEPDELQASVLLAEQGRGILNCSRQWGKSSVAAVKAIHRACSRPDTTVLVAAPSRRQSAQFLVRAKKLMRAGGMRIKGDGANELSLGFPNGSRIVGLPGVEETVRGFTASLVLIDEASRVSDAMYEALRPMLAVEDGDLWLMSTPYEKRGFFWETWEYGGPDGFRVKAPVSQCSRISAKFLAKEQAGLDESVYRREYMCEFLDNRYAVFDQKLIEAAMDDEVFQLEF